MFASIVTEDRCELFTVLRTNLSTYERVALSYPPTDFDTAVRRARIYQESFDSQRTSYDYRVTACY